MGFFCCWLLMQDNQWPVMFSKKCCAFINCVLKVSSADDKMRARVGNSFEIRGICHSRTSRTLFLFIRSIVLLGCTSLPA